jgi:hypothetical protein
VTASRTAVAVCAAVLAFAVAGCSSDEDKSAKAARTAAQKAFDKYSSGDYAGAWETYTDEGQAAISKADFVSFNDQCPPKIRDKKISVTGARLANSRTALAQVRVGDAQSTYTLRYEHGHWRLQPSADATAMWRLGVTKAVAQAKASGQC